MSKHIQLIIGSTRQNRIAPHIAEWVKAQAVQVEGLDLEVVDLKEWDLPFMDAAVPPSAAPIDTLEARRWTAKLAEAEGFIFLTAEYNRGIPAPLKNALDYTVAEWADKPAAVISYGYVDGGASAARHLKDVLTWLKLKIAEPMVALKLGRDSFNEDGSLKDAGTQFADAAEQAKTALAEIAA